MCRTVGQVIDSIHDFQRQGGLNRQFEHLDNLFSAYLVARSDSTEADEQPKEEYSTVTVSEQ
jgi:hypothetical protein